MSHPNETLVRRLFGAIRDGDHEELREVLAEDATWVVPGESPLAGTYRGVDEVLRYFGLLRELSDGTFQGRVTDVASSDEHAVAIARATGARGGQPVYDAGYLLLFETADGRISGARLFPEDQRVFDGYWSGAS